MYQQKHFALLFYLIHCSVMAALLHECIKNSSYKKFSWPSQMKAPWAKKNKQLESFSLSFNHPQAVHHLIAQTAVSPRPVIGPVCAVLRDLLSQRLGESLPVRNIQGGLEVAATVECVCVFVCRGWGEAQYHFQLKSSA